MNFHPDVLAVHAQFGGDLESMQALYDRPGHVAEIARLQEQVETLRKERDEARASAERQWEGWIKEEGLRKAAEAERDRPREGNARMVEALKEAEAELYQVPPADAEQERVLAIVRAALQKEHQP